MPETSTQQRAADPRASLREKRRRRLRLIAGDRPATVKVFAANETMRDVLRHPVGARFRDDMSAEWPNDSFTARRIKDGSVRIDGPGSGEQQPDDPSLNAREHSAARKPKKEEPEKEAPDETKEAKESPRNGSRSKPPPPEPQPAA
jgi:hypothetical protein